MGTIIQMTSKELVKDFLPNIKDVNDYNFITISENVRVKNKLENVKAIPRLIPPIAAMNLFTSGDKKGYKKAYHQYLNTIEIDAFIYIMLKAVVDHDLKLVLICSPFEAQFNYIKLLTDYIESIYDLKTYTVKSYLKDKESAHKISNLDTVRAIINKKAEKLEKSGIDINPDKSDKELIKDLKQLKKKDLIKMAKKRNVKIKKGDGRKKIAKAIAKTKKVF